MKKRITAFVFACVLVLVSALPAFAVPAPPYSGTVADERAYPLLVDDADILSDYDEQRLLTKLESISTKWDMDVAIVTIENLDNRDIEAYTDDFYDYYGYDADGTPQDSQSKEMLPLFWIPLSIVIALVVALLVGMHYKNELKTVRFEAEANSYVVPGSMNITVSNDHFIRSHVTRTAIPKSNDNDLGSSGGGSSTHSSSSGSSHGGSSGSF